MNATELAVLEKRVHAITRPEPALLWMYLLTALALLCAAPIVFIPLYFGYQTLWYRFEPNGVSMGYGILFRREMQLTYARMQGDLYDAGVLNLKTGEYKTLDQQIRMPPYLLDDAGSKVAYIIAESKSETTTYAYIDVPSEALMTA